MNPLFRKTGVIAIAALLGCACDSKTVVEKLMFDPPLKPGQVLDKTSEYAKTWPGRPALFKLANGMLFQIPPQHQAFWYQGDKVTRPPADLSKVPVVRSIGFIFFMPDYSGYTPENYKVEFHEDIVEVVYVRYEGLGAEQPGAPGAYPPNGFKSQTTPPRLIEPDQVEPKFALSCYPSPPGDKAFQNCYAPRDHLIGDFIKVRIMTPPYDDWVKYPLMQARYFTPKYGGMEIVWRAHMKHFPKWAEIDQQIWKFIDEWNIANQVNPTSPSK